MRVVIAVVVSLILASNAWAEVTITGQVLGMRYRHEEGGRLSRTLDEEYIPAPSLSVTMYPSRTVAMTDGEGRFTFTADSLEDYLVVVTGEKDVRCARESIRGNVISEKPEGTFNLMPIRFPYDDPSVFPNVPRLTIPEPCIRLGTLGGFDPPCRVERGDTEIVVVCRIDVSEDGTVTRAEVLGRKSDPLPCELAKRAADRLKGVKFVPAIDQRTCEPTASGPWAYPINLIYDEDDGWRFSSRGPVPDGTLRH